VNASRLGEVARRLTFACVTALVIAAPVAGSQPVNTAPTPAPQTNPALEARVRELSAQLRCVVCQGLSIEDSPSELAMEMKSVVREQLAAGKSPDEVKRYFVDKYGEWILLQPKAEGFNLVVYLVPVAFVIGGIAFLVLAVRRWTRSGGDAAAADESTA
jgi:cytochrome c-type biogenesis protein CcmH